MQMKYPHICAVVQHICKKSPAGGPDGAYMWPYSCMGQGREIFIEHVVVMAALANSGESKIYPRKIAGMAAREYFI